MRDGAQGGGGNRSKVRGRLRTSPCRADQLGLGHARRLYDDLAAIATDRPLCCEVNRVPPNPASLAFHERLGFAACGEGDDPHNGERVRYLRRSLVTAPDERERCCVAIGGERCKARPACRIAAADGALDDYTHASEWHVGLVTRPGLW